VRQISRLWVREAQLNGLELVVIAGLEFTSAAYN
jgi:hypothetical protein